MMTGLRFIGDRYVSESFQNLLQLSASTMLDGTGSSVTDIVIKGEVGSKFFTGSNVTVKSTAGYYQLLVADNLNNKSFGVSGHNIINFGTKQTLPSALETGSIVKVANDLYLCIEDSLDF
jgi:hypothetical protein